MLARCVNAIATESETAVDSPDLCRVEGRVVNAVTGEPVRRANITLGPTGVGSSAPSLKATVSDGEGRFALEDLAAGTYVVRTERTGFRIGAYVPPPAITSVERLKLSAGDQPALTARVVLIRDPPRPALMEYWVALASVRDIQIHWHGAW